VGDDEDDLPVLGNAPDIDVHISPAYMTCIRSHVVNAAAIAQKAGRSVQALGDVVVPAVVERLVRTRLAAQRAKNPNHPQKNATLKNTVTGLLKVARLIEAPESTLAALEDLRDKVDPHLKKKKRGKDAKIKREYFEHRMGPRHKERIEAMANDFALFNWFRMIPVLRERLQKIVDEGRKPTPEEANDAVALVLHALTRRCPLRRANLGRIPVYGPMPWLRMPVVEGGRARLTVPAEYVKNGIQITVDLDPAAVEILALYLKHVRPVIAARTGADADNPYLFPAKGQRHRAYDSLNEIFTDRNWRIGGFRLNLHCQRHLAGKIILDRDPTKMVLVQRLLGHKRISTTERYYTEINQIFVQREYHAMLDEEFERLLLAQQQRKRRQP
jgi:integrase